VNLYVDEPQNRLFLDDSLHKAVGSKGKVYIFGDSHTGGMKSYFRNYYKNLGYDPKDVIIKIKNNGRYSDMVNRLSEYSFNPNDQIIIGSIGGPEARQDRLNKHSVRIDPLIRKLVEQRDRGVKVKVFGHPIGGNAKLTPNRLKLAPIQQRSFKNAGIEYHDVAAGSQKIQSKLNDIHFGKNYGKYFNNMILSNLGKVRQQSVKNMKFGAPKAPKLSTAAPVQPKTFSSTPNLGSLPENLRQWDPLVSKYSKMYGVPRAHIYSIMQTESGGNKDAGLPAWRKKAAQGQPNKQGLGLMQVIPSTFKGVTAKMRRRGVNVNWDGGSLKSNLDPEANIHVATYFIKDQLDKVKRDYPEARDNHELAYKLSAMRYYMGAGGERKYTKKWLAKTGQLNPSSWDVDSTSKTGHVRKTGASYAALSYKRFKAMESKLGGSTGYKAPKLASSASSFKASSTKKPPPLKKQSSLARLREAATFAIRKESVARPKRPMQNTRAKDFGTMPKPKTPSSLQTTAVKAKSSAVNKSLYINSENLVSRGFKKSRFQSENFIDLNGSR